MTAEKNIGLDTFITKAASQALPLCIMSVGVFIGCAFLKPLALSFFSLWPLVLLFVIATAGFVGIAQRQVQLLCLSCISILLGLLLQSTHPLAQHTVTERPSFLIDANCQIEQIYYRGEYNQIARVRIMDAQIPAYADLPLDMREGDIKVFAKDFPYLRIDDIWRFRGLCRWDEYRGQHFWALDVKRQDLIRDRNNGPRGLAWQALDTYGAERDLAQLLFMGRGQATERTIFREAGLAHVLAVSGLHVGVVLLLLTFAALRAFTFVKQRFLKDPDANTLFIQVLLVLGVIAFYVWFTGSAIPTRRAGIMVAMYFTASLLSRKLFPLAPLALAVLINLAWDPLDARRLGFHLSVAAVLGILTLGRELIAWRKYYLPLKPWPLDRPSYIALQWLTRWTLDAWCVGFAAGLAVLPLVALHFGVINMWTSLLTIAVSPFLIVALGAGLLFLLLESLLPQGPWFVAQYFSAEALKGLYQLSEWAASWPGSSMPVSLGASNPLMWIILSLWPLLFFGIFPYYPRLKDLGLRKKMVAIVFMRLSCAVFFIQLFLFA